MRRALLAAATATSCLAVLSTVSSTALGVQVEPGQPGQQERPYAGRALQQLEADTVRFLVGHGFPDAVAYPTRFGNTHVVTACDAGTACVGAAGLFTPRGILIDAGLTDQVVGCYRMRGRTAAARDRLGWECVEVAHILLHETLHGVHAEANRSPVMDEGLVDAVATDLAPGLNYEWTGQDEPATPAYPREVTAVRAASAAVCHQAWSSSCAVWLRRYWLNTWSPAVWRAGGL